MNVIGIVKDIGEDWVLFSIDGTLVDLKVSALNGDLSNVKKGQRIKIEMNGMSEDEIEQARRLMNQ